MRLPLPGPYVELTMDLLVFLEAAYIVAVSAVVVLVLRLLMSN